MPIILIDINIFTDLQSVLRIDPQAEKCETLGKTSLEHLAEFVVSKCYETKTYKVRLFGIKEYVLDYKDKITKYDYCYRENKIVVEVE